MVKPFIYGLKRISLLLIISLSMFSCVGNEKGYKIAVSQCSDDDWRRQMNNEIKREASLYDNITVDIFNAHDDTELQVKHIQKFVKDGYDAIIVAPNEAEPLSSVVESVYESGIPIIVVDRNVLTDKYTAWVGANNYQAGYKMGEYIMKRLNGKGKVIEITGLEGSSTAQERQNGFRNAIVGSDIEVVGCASALWFEDLAEYVADSLIRLNPDVDLIFAHADRMAYGAYKAAKKLNREDIIFIGIDALAVENGGAYHISEGIIDASIVYPTGGDIALDVTLKALKGQDYAKHTILKTQIVTSENVDVLISQKEVLDALDKKITYLDEKTSSLTLKNNKKSLVLFSLVVLVVLFFIASFFLERVNRKVRRYNKQLSDQKNQLETQQQKLVEMSRELESATNYKLQFFNNISHDFRTPLTLILDPVRQLKDSGIKDQRQLKLLTTIGNNAEILLELVNELLDFHKAESGKQKLQPRKFDINNALESWFQYFTPAVIDKHIKISYEVDTDCGYLMIGDMSKIERIFFNIMSNAVKHTPENGKIIVALKSTPENISFSVTDTGKGISQDNIDKIFNRFYQVEPSSAGAGLGLALCKLFVEMHNGKIDVKSIIDKGTTFTVTFPKGNLDSMQELTIPDSSVSQSRWQPNYPMRQGPTRTWEEEMDLEKDNQEQITILVVDDNKEIRAYICDILSEHYKIIEAENGEEGYVLATKYIPDLIVSDVVMPKMDGVAMCQKLKQEILTSHIPIILLTAYYMDEQQISSYNKGAEAYISKPFNSSILLAHIESILFNRKLYKDKLNSGVGEISDVLDERTDFDVVFRGKIFSILKENISNSQFTIDDLGLQMGFSRSQLYRKCKQTLNFLPLELMRQIRLEHAHQMIMSTSLSIKEICYKCGFTSNSYFIKCYREEYGKTPGNTRPTDYVITYKKTKAI